MAGVLTGDDEDATQPEADSSAGSEAATVDRTAIIDVEALDEAEELPTVGISDSDDDDRPTTAVPSFSVLFQAPDASQAVPTRRRRGTPQPAVEEPVEEREDDEPVAADEDLSETDEQPDAQSDEESGPRRSRRRRGGKGRRGRGNDEDEAQDQQADSDDSRGSRGARRGSAETVDEAEADRDDRDRRRHRG